MPSSVIFVGLVLLWLLILVPAVARRQQEVARLSPALLSGRVLERPVRHRFPEVGVMERLDDRRATTVGELVERRDDDVPRPRERQDAATRGAPAGDDADMLGDSDVLGDADVLDDEFDDDRSDGRTRHADAEPDDRHPAPGVDGRFDLDEDEGERLWERPPARYRPGRGGYDPDAAAVAAHAKYAFRQRVVLGLLVLLLASAALALLVATPIWWASGALGAGLAGYLTYLRRQVRIEEAIRERRAARLAGTRRTAAADDPELDDWARRGREAVRDDRDPEDDRAGEAPDADAEQIGTDEDDDEDWTADDGEPTRIRGTGEPLGVLPARRRTADGTGEGEPASTLPRLAAAPPPPIPAGTSLVDVDDEDELDAAASRTEHRRAAGE